MKNNKHTEESTEREREREGGWRERERERKSNWWIERCRD
jgi:hypothetical protein